jgi:hypothetical protein
LLPKKKKNANRENQKQRETKIGKTENYNYKITIRSWSTRAKETWGKLLLVFHENNRTALGERCF